MRYTKETHYIYRWLTVLTILTLTWLLILSRPARAADPWSKADIQREVACITLNLMDYATTDKILGDNPTRAMELNPFLGSHPSRNTLIVTTVGVSAAHVLITHYLPARYRQYWQWSWIGLKMGVVGNNLHLGLGLQF